MKKKAFTLIELLAIILILSIVLTITIPTVSSIIASANLNSFMTGQKIMINATKLYLGINEQLLPSNIGETIEVKLSSLQSDDLISIIRNPWNNKDICDGYVLVTKIGPNQFDYVPHLKCDNNYKADSYITDCLVASWKLDGNAYDYTPNSNLGIIQNVSTTTNRFGTLNTALEFDGPSNFIDTNFDYSLDYNKGSTFSLWVRFDTINTSGKIKNLLGKNSKEFILSQIDDKIQFTVWNNKGDYAIQLVSNTSIEINKWYNIAVVYDNFKKQVYLYVNAVIDSTASVLTYPFENKTETLKIGRGYPDVGSASSTFFIGVIDNIKIYDRSLSSFEIKLYYDIDQLMKW